MDTIHVTKNADVAGAFESVVTVDELMALLGSTDGLMTTVYAALAALPTVDPLADGAFWLDTGVLTISAGAA
jgi:hypothetical protein